MSASNNRKSRRAAAKAARRRAPANRTVPQHAEMQAPPGGYATFDLGSGRFRHCVDRDLMAAAQKQMFGRWEEARQAEICLGSPGARMRARWVLWLIGVVERERTLGTPTDYILPGHELIEAIRDVDAGIRVPDFEPVAPNQRSPTVERNAEAAISGVIEHRYALDKLRSGTANYERAAENVVNDIHTRLHEFAREHGLRPDSLTLDVLLPGQVDKGTGKPKRDSVSRAASFRKAYATAYRQEREIADRLEEAVEHGLSDQEHAELRMQSTKLADNFAFLIYQQCRMYIDHSPQGDSTQALRLDRTYPNVLELAARAVLRLANFEGVGDTHGQCSRDDQQKAEKPTL